MQDPKPLMQLVKNNMDGLHQQHATGMGFYIVKTLNGYLAVLHDGTALPLYTDKTFYCIDDLVRGNLLPITTQRKAFSFYESLKCSHNRNTAASALRQANVSSAYAGTSGPFPLIISVQLQAATEFLRYVCSPVDRRFVQGELNQGTYITTDRELAHADTGLGAVGRFALPIPLPASYVFRYRLSAGTTINIGTVAPLFGQSGGGVEICLPVNTPATQIKRIQLPDY